MPCYEKEEQCMENPDCQLCISVSLPADFDSGFLQLYHLCKYWHGTGLFFRQLQDPFYQPGAGTDDRGYPSVGVHGGNTVHHIGNLGGHWFLLFQEEFVPADVHHQPDSGYQCGCGDRIFHLYFAGGCSGGQQGHLYSPGYWACGIRRSLCLSVGFA